MKKFFVCSIVAISMMAGIGVPSVALATSNVEINEVEQNKEKEKVTNEFLAMQDQITSVLTIENGHYVYDKETVKNIVNGFDFDELNEKQEFLTQLKLSIMKRSVILIQPRL